MPPRKPEHRPKEVATVGRKDGDGRRCGSPERSPRRVFRPHRGVMRKWGTVPEPSGNRPGR
ncbi:hypothetical protein HMPREF9440_01881 [Sutterella parvirubra YIT 11816]|uniref:Uncharacterized protein n=1 Tax=Sutterella parvirubra YIT 11816 TaxID=762967 RepID=H3KGK1_9BURK|nr:hypothetical protein HMPREF9440_01881 [Sutterella parvirubra YIT 11816]